MLVCKKTGKKYVGASYNVKRRTDHHLKNKFKNHSASMLEKVKRKLLPKAEAEWIKKIKPELNVRLGQVGGAGLVRPIETKRRMSAWQKGKNKPHNNGPSISKALKGVPKSIKHKLAAAKARKAVGNKPWTEAQRKANIWTKERKAKLSKSKKGKPWSKARHAAQQKR